MPFRRIIELNEEFMDYASYDEIEILIYHELTHCLFLYMKHKDDIYHVMNTYLMPSYGPLGREFHLNMMFEEAKNHNFWFSLFNF
jgi:predicted SprT family Zn-dependent metalloprotease